MLLYRQLGFAVSISLFKIRFNVLKRVHCVLVITCFVISVVSSQANYYTEGLRVTGLKIQKKKASYHMSICVEYSVDPKRTSGGLYLKNKPIHFSLIQRMLHEGAVKHKGPVNYTRSNPNRGLTQAVGLRYSL